MEWAEDGVRVNSVAPGLVVSPTARANYSTDVFELGRTGVPVKRLGVTQEVGKCLLDCFETSSAAPIPTPPPLFWIISLINVFVIGANFE